MDKRDPIEEFMSNYGRLYNRLEPRDQEFVRNSLEQEREQLRNRSMAPDQSKDTLDPSPALPETEKSKHLERDADVVEKKEDLEKSWLAEMKSRAEQSMYTGHGKTDELSVSSGGQFSASFSQQARPGSTQADLDNAVEKMGLGPARDRQQLAETEKESDKSRDLGKEAER